MGVKELRESAGYDEDAKRQEIINVLVDRDLEFENEVVEQRMQQSKKTNKFVNFWERSRGITKIISGRWRRIYHWCCT